MEEFVFYQLVTLDGLETPIWYFRQGKHSDDMWNPTTKRWVPTDRLMHMLIRNETNLDRLDYDPVANFDGSSEVPEAPSGNPRN